MMSNYKSLFEIAINDALLMTDRYNLAQKEMELFHENAAREARKLEVCHLAALCSFYTQELDKKKMSNFFNTICKVLKDLTGKAINKKTIKVYSSGWSGYSFVIEFSIGKKSFEIMLPNYPKINDWQTLTFCNMGKYTLYERKDDCWREACSDYDYETFTNKLKETLK